MQKIKIKNENGMIHITYLKKFFITNINIIIIHILEELRIFF
jgi:hypothetical protein